MITIARYPCLIIEKSVVQEATALASGERVSVLKEWSRKSGKDRRIGKENRSVTDCFLCEEMAALSP